MLLVLLLSWLRVLRHCPREAAKMHRTLLLVLLLKQSILEHV